MITPRQLLASYETAFRNRLLVSPEDAEDPAVLQVVLRQLRESFA